MHTNHDTRGVKKEIEPISPKSKIVIDLFDRHLTRLFPVDQFIFIGHPVKSPVLRQPGLTVISNSFDTYTRIF